MFETEAEQLPEQHDKDNEAQEWAAAESIAAGVDSASVTINGEPVQVGLDAMLTPMLSSAFSILAPAWEVSQDECAALGKSWSDVAEVWFPDAQLSPKWAVLVTAVVTTGMVVAPRLQAGTPRKIEEKAPEKEVNRGPI